MQINRNNYEAFFLLYADGELSREEMQAVEAFAGHHPDLAEELQLLLDIRLSPDTHTMPQKHTLIRLETWDADDLSPAQLAMLTHLDGELPAEALESLEAAAAEDPQLRREWEWLTNVRLEEESAAMPGKASLVKLSPWDEASLSPAQQSMLALLDGHLAGSEALALHQEMDQDIVLQKEWQVLQQVKLMPEAMEMPNKERLLRREGAEKVPVFRMTVTRWMAAAAIMTGIGWFVFNGLDRPLAPADQEMAQNAPGLQEGPSTGDKPEAKQAEAAEMVTVEETDLPPAEIGPATRPAVAPPISERQLPTVATYASQSAGPQQPDALSAPSLRRETGLDATPGQELAGLWDTDASLNARGITNPLQQDLYRQAASQETVEATYASYIEPEPFEDETVNIAGARIPRQKLRGIFRTVGRTVTRSFDKGNVAPAEMTYVAEPK